MAILDPSRFNIKPGSEKNTSISIDPTRIHLSKMTENDIKYNKSVMNEKINSQRSDILLSAPKIVNGRLTVDNDALAQSKGFINAMDEVNYKANNPDLYEASGGVKVIKPCTNVDMSGAPLKSVGTYDHNYATNLSSAAVNKAYENSNSDKVKEVENIVDTIKTGKWLDANTMKKYSETVSSYANGVILLNELGLLNNTEEDRKSTIDNLKTLKDDINKIKDYYAEYKDVDSYNKSVWNNKYGVMTWDELIERQKQLQVSLPSQDSSTMKELAFINNILSTRDKQMWDAMVNLKGKNINEINEVADGYKYASEDYKKYNGYIETFKNTHKDAEIKDFESDEEIDAYVKEAREFFVEYRKENGSFDGAREAYQLKKGYLNYDGKPDKKDEKSTFLLDMAEKLARLEVSYGNEKFVEDFYEKEEEYRWNLMSSQEFRKYYAEMQDDPNASSYIAKGKEKYDIKDENISEEEYNVACYHLGKGATKKHNYFVWLKDWVYKREVAAKDGWSALSDGETLKYHTLWSDYTNDVPLEANIMSVALNLGSGIEFAYNALNGEIKESKLSKASSKIREAYANSHDGEFLGIDYDFLYNTVMSGIDSLTAGKLFGKGKEAVEAASILLGLSAAASGVNDALDRGMTGAQALFNGLANGINEYFWEKVSLGQLDKLSASNGAGFKTWFKNLLKASFVNATEETATEAANMLYDTVFNGDLSHYSLSVQRYIDNGLTEEEAKNQALKDLGNQIAEAAGSGALMGFGFSFVGNTSASINAARYGKYYYGFSQKSVYALTENGLAMPESSKAYKLAVKAEAKLKKGKNLSGTALYNLVTAIESEIETKSETRFSELGIDKKTTKALSPIVAKAVFGEKLSSAEHSTLNNSEIATQVVKELSADRANTIWKDAIKNNSVNFSVSSNKNTILHSESNDNIINNVGDDYVDEKVNAKDIEKISQVDVLSNVSGESHRADNESYENKALNEVELAAVLKYKSSASYLINDLLRNSENLSDVEAEFVRNMDDALIKMPTYQGTVYRNIAFDWFGGQEAYDAFLSEHKVGYVVNYLAFTSASIKEDGYLVDGRFAVSMVIESGNAKNVDGYGNNFESEVIFPRNSVFVVNNVKYNDKGQPIIYMTEVIRNDEGKHGQFYSKERSEVVQSLSKSQPRYSDLQDISEDNTTRCYDRKNYLQSVSGKERGLNYFDHKEIEKLKEGFEDKVESRLLELGIDNKTTKALSPIVAKAVFGEKLNSAEHTTLNNSEIATQVVKELSADRANTVWKDAIKNSRINNSTDNNSVTEQGKVSQSTADGVVDNDIVATQYTANSKLQSNKNNNIINSVGDIYVDEETNSEGVRKIREKYFQKIGENFQGGISESAEIFSERARRNSLEGSGQERLLLNEGKLIVAYTPVKDDNSPKNIFFKKLRERGIDIYYCDGVIETNVDGVTMVHNQAITTRGGKIFVSSVATVEFKSMMDHELVHWKMRTFSDSYFEYEDIILRNLNRESNYYIAFCEELNLREYNNRYDINTIEGAIALNSEITAYVYQYVLNDSNFAENFFSKMFFDWHNVKTAVREFNSKMEINTELLNQVGSKDESAFFAYKNKIENNTTEQGEVLQSSADGEINGSGDEYFGDSLGDDVTHGDTSAVGEAIDGENSNDLQLSEPALKDIARAPTAEEAIEEAITGKQKTNIQRHIVDICKKLDSNVTVEFVNKLEGNGKFIRSQNKILIKSDLNAVQMYVEVFKHEFMHRLETKRLYSKFFNFCFKKSKAFEQYVRAEVKLIDNNNVDDMARESVLNLYTEYKYNQYINDKNIPSEDRDAFTMENSQEEIIADFFAQILFQGKKYRARIIEALENADGGALIGIGDEVSSEAALLELQQKEPTLFEQVVQWVRDIIDKLRGMPQAKSVVTDLEYMESLLTRVYNSRDSKRLNRQKQGEVKYSFGVTQNDIDDYVDAAYAKENTEDYKKYAIPTEKLINDVSDEIDISDYVHALRDNDIRHIKNSHGEETNEKYPVTSDDIKLIPWIVQNYDKVFVIRREKGKTGIIYVKVNEDGLIYFLEQVTTIYGNEPLLVNKQMIKTGIEDIPNLKGFVDAINKKESEAEFLADLKKVHEVYAQSVYQPHYNINISNHKENVKRNNAINKKMSSSQYLADLNEIRKAYVQDVKENYFNFIIPNSFGNVNIEGNNGASLDQYSLSSPLQELKNNNEFELSEPDIDNIEISDEVEFLVGLNGVKLSKTQKHIVDICKNLDSNVTVEFVDDLKTNGKFIRSQNKILIKSNLNAVQMYVEVFKHEFMHRLETKALYSNFFNYCFKKSKAFEQYVRAELKSTGVDFNVDTATRDGALEAYTKYKFNQYKNSRDIPKTDSEAFTMENAQEEIIADFFAQILFQGKKYRARIIEALENADGEILIGIGDEISSEAALMELKQKEPTLLEQVIQWLKDVINRLRGIPQAKNLVEQLDNEINLLESMARRTYQSKDSKRLLKKKLDEIKFSLMNNNTFESNVDIVSTMNDADALQNKEEGNFVRVMYGTPSIVHENVEDAENLDVIISFYSLYLATRKNGVLEGHYHNLGSEIIKKLPDYINNPDAIVRTNNGRLNLFTQIETPKGNNGILSIELNTVKDINNHYGKYNLVVTVFSAGDNYTRNNIIKNAIKVEYQKEDLLQVNPQLYEWLTIVNNKSSLSNINEKELVVNSKDAKLKSLHITSAYINKKDTFSDVLVSKDPKRYVQDDHQPNVSSNSITHTTRKVKETSETYRSKDSKRLMKKKLAEEKYSIINLDTGKSYVQASRQVIRGNSVADWRSQISEFFNKSLKNGPIEITTIEGDILTISKDTANKARDKHISENGVTRELTDKEFLVKLNAEAHIDELAEISVSKKDKNENKKIVPDNKNHDIAKDGFTYRTVYFQDFDDAYYRVTLSVGENNGISTVYNVGKIKADDIPNGNIVSAIGSKADMSSTKYSILNPTKKVKQKDVFGFKINENADINEDLLEEVRYYHPDAEVDEQGNITVYHRTTKENATVIKRTGIMTAKEDTLFFSSKESGYASDYGDTVVKFKIPSTELQVNDIFDGEVHFDLPLKYKNGGYSLDVSKYLIESNDTPSGQYSLGSPIQQMRYNPEAYAKHLNRKYQSKADKDMVAKKIKQIVAKAVFGENLTQQEQETLNSNEVAAQVVKELSADRINTVWKDAIKNSSINNLTENNAVTEQGDVLQSSANDVVDNVADSTIAQQDGEVDAPEGVGDVQSDSNGAAAPGVVEDADAKQYFDDGSGDNITKSNVVDNKVNNIGRKEYDKFFFKKPIKVSQKDWSKVNAARLQKYSNYSEGDIPDVDFFRIAEYNQINIAYKYVVRNYDKYNFEIVFRIKIKSEASQVRLEEKDYDETAYTTDDASRVRLGSNRNGSFSIGYGQAIRNDDSVVGVGEESDKRRSVNKDDSDSGRRIDNSDIKTATSETEVAFSMPRDYSYEALISKPDIEITEIDSFNGKINNDTRKDIIDKAVENAAAIGRKNENGNAVIYVKDIDTEIILSKSGLRHGLDRRFELLAPVLLKSGEILKNSIRINELIPRVDDISKSYVLISVAKNMKNEPYIISFVVNKVTSEVSAVDVLYAINAKTEPAGSLSPSVPAKEADYFTDSTISISELLDYVNKYFPDILPESVLRHYGYEARPDGKIGESALFSIPIGKRKNTVKNNVIELSKNNELSKQIGDLHGTEKYKVIQDYILNALDGEQIVLSDGKKAVVDKSDARHISQSAGSKKVAQISEIKRIVESAALIAEENSSKERKFDYFYYYETTVKYDGEVFNVYLNVGRARNDATYHLYDITQKLRDTAHRVNDVGRPVGDALKNDISNSSITKNSDVVNNNYSTKTDILDELLDNKTNNIDKSDDYKFSISKTKNMDWIHQIYGLYNKNGQIIRSDTLVVETETPLYLRLDGIKNLPLAIPLSVVTKATNGKDQSHSIKQENIIKLQNGIRNADIVIKNSERNSFVFLTNIKQDGYPVLISFLQDVDFDGDRVHKATSIHLQIDVNSMLEALPSDATVYLKNKNEFNDTVGVTNNLRSLAANIEFIDEILSQNGGVVNNNYSTNVDMFDGLKELNVREKEYIQRVCNQLGCQVVFEDLREMKYKGEILSPDGYIGSDGVIHINTYAENPIGFILKHELTHFGEKSSRYIEFVKTVKKSKLYKNWITEKTGESDLRIAEYKYKQAVANAHSDIYGAADPKAEAEMIADFVGDMLFTENGSGIVALASDLDTKQRNAVVQFVIDFISFIKKKLSGQKFMTLQLSMLEDSFRRMLFDATQMQNGGVYTYDNGVSFCFAPCNDDKQIAIAEKLEAEGKDSHYIFRQCGLIKDAYGKWKYELNTSGFGFFSSGNARTESHYINNKIIKPGGILEGKLSDFIYYKELFKAFPQAKDIKVIVRNLQSGVAKFYIDRYDNDKPVIVLNKKVCDEYISDKPSEIKPALLRELQHVIQYYSGEASGTSIEKWENLEKEGKTPYLQELGRNLTAEEAYMYSADNYEAAMVEKREAFKEHFVKKRFATTQEVEKMVLYAPNFDRNKAVITDEDGNYVVVKDYETSKIQPSIVDENVDAEDVVDVVEEHFTEDDSLKSTNIETIDANMNATHKLIKILMGGSGNNRYDINQLRTITAGDDSALSNFAENAKQFANYYNAEKIKELCDIEPSRRDTAGRVLSDEILERFKNTFLKNKDGKIVPLYMLKMQDVGRFAREKIGIEAGTLESVSQLYSKYNKKSLNDRQVNIQEVIINMTNPLVLDYTPFELSLVGLHDLVERGILYYSEWLNLINFKRVSLINYTNNITKKIRARIKADGYDGIIYFNDSTDAGSMTVVAFDEDQILTVAENGVLSENNGISEPKIDLNELENNNIAVRNSREIRLFASDVKYRNRKLHRIPSEKIRAGNSGFIDSTTNIQEEAYKNLREALNNANKELNGKDTVDREQKKSVMNMLDNTVFQDEKGTLLSLYAFLPRNILSDKTIFGTFNSAIKEFISSKEKAKYALLGTMCEVYINSVNPLVVKADEYDVKIIAEQLLSAGKITQKEYYNLISYKSSYKTRIKNKLITKGYDSVILVKGNGEYAVVPFDESQIIAVSSNGILNDGVDVVQTDETGYEHNKDYDDGSVFIDGGLKIAVDLNAVKDILSVEDDNTVKMKLLTKVLMCGNNPNIDYTNEYKAGSSGALEKGELNPWRARAVIESIASRDLSDITISDTDTAGRSISEYQKKLLLESKFIDRLGRPYSVFFGNRHGNTRFIHSNIGICVGTLNAAHDTMVAESKQKFKRNKIVFEEYYPIIKNPYFIMFEPNDITAAELAKYMYAEGLLNDKQYNIALSKVGAHTHVYNSNSARYLIRRLRHLGFDSIAFMNERYDPGSISLIIFDGSQLIPVSHDGLPIENSDRTLADSDNEPAFFMPENNGENFVEKSQMESVENVDENGIIEETVDNDTGVPGEYTYEIVWQGRKVPARRDGKGHRGPRTKQHNERVNNYELKLNPDNESYFLDHPDGKTVQFENMKNGIVQDCKLVMDKHSIYYVKEKIPVLNKNILKQANRQLEAANPVGYKVQWLVSDQKAVDQMIELFNENNLDIIVIYYPE